MTSLTPDLVKNREMIPSITRVWRPFLKLSVLGLTGATVIGLKFSEPKRTSEYRRSLWLNSGSAYCSDKEERPTKVKNIPENRVTVKIRDDQYFPVAPARIPRPVTKPKATEANITCKQHLYFWGSRDNLPYGFDNEIHRPSESETKPSRGSVQPYLEDVGPQDNGHFTPHGSRWFDTHQYGWKSIEFGSHFGGAVSEDGDVS